MKYERLDAMHNASVYARLYFKNVQPHSDVIISRQALQNELGGAREINSPGSAFKYFNSRNEIPSIQNKRRIIDFTSLNE